MMDLSAVCILDVFNQFSAFIIFIAQFAPQITTSHCCAIRVANKKARQKHVSRSEVRAAMMLLEGPLKTKAVVQQFTIS
jgi:hypothetical protein